MRIKRHPVPFKYVPYIFMVAVVSEHFHQCDGIIFFPHKTLQN